MKTLISLFSIILCLSYGKAQWVELDTGLENPPVFNDVYAITPDIVVVVGASGTILKTTDGGETWVQKPSGTTEHLRKVQFPTPEIGYVVAAGNAFLKTTDGGETWFPIDTGTDCFFYNFSCVDENLIFITCSGNLMKSEDGGGVWNEIAPLSGGEIQFLNNEIGYAGEDTGGFFKTEDGGETWQELIGIPRPFQFLDENIGFYYMTGLYKTTDGGNNFELLGAGEGDLFSHIFVIGEDATWGILMGLLNGDGSSRGIVKILPSEPYTETIAWEDNDEIDMYSIHFANENIGYIVGIKNGKGAIWKNGTGINTMSMEEHLIEKLKVYPNPVSGKLNIDFDKPTKADISLTDMTGKKVYTQSFTENKISIDVRNIVAKGIYILKVNNYSQKIIIN